MRRTTASIWLFLQVAAFTFLAALAGLLTQPAAGLPILWPANALLAGLFLSRPYLATPAAWPAAGAALVLAGITWGESPLASLSYGLVNLIGTFVGWRLLAAPGALSDLCQPRAALRILFAGTAAAASQAAAAGLLALWLGADTDWMPVLANWFLGPLLSYCIFLPPILLLPAPGHRDRRRPALRARERSRLETWLPLVSLAIGLALCFLIGGLGILAFPIPPLLYCALAYRPHITAWLALLAALVVTLGTVYGWIPFGIGPILTDASSWDMVSLRLGALLMVIAPLIMSCALAARGDTISALNRALDHDTLTGILSRQAFLRDAQTGLRHSAAHLGTGLLMLDIDHFKQLNDTHGHAVGDRVLQAFARTVGATIRPHDLFGRLGGEEFGVALPGTAPTEVAFIAERLRTGVADAVMAPAADATPIHITVSIGAVHDSLHAHATLDTLLSYADHAMYQAKRGGRDRVCFLDDTPITTTDPPRDDPVPAHDADQTNLPATASPPASEVPMSEPTPLIAVLEDDPAQSAWIRQTLTDAGFSCQAFNEGGALLAALRARTPFALLLLDWELPGINGMEVLRWVRANRHDALPVIFVTNRTLESDLVEGLNSGADDYICKPCRTGELLARIGAQMRRHRPSTSPDADFTLEDFTVDMSLRQIRLRDEPIALTPKEFELAALFLRHPWRLFSRDDLSALVWNREIPSASRTLDTHLSNIRKKLHLGPATGTLLSASYALGYRLELLPPPDQDTRP